MVSVIASVHDAVMTKLPVSLWLHADRGTLSYEVELPGQIRTSFLQELQDVYPGCSVEPVNARMVDQQLEKWNMELRLRPDVLPLLTFESFIDETDSRSLSDPIAGLLSALRTGRSRRVTCSIRLSIRPAARRRVAGAERILRRSRHRFATEVSRTMYTKLATDHRIICRRIGTLLSFAASREPCTEAGIAKTDMKLFECRLTLFATVPAGERSIAVRKLNEIAGTFGRYTDGTVHFRRFRPTRRERRVRTFLLTPREVATIWHPITASGDTVSRMARPTFREIEPPVVLASKKDRTDETVLGRTQFRQQRSQFGIATDDLRRHLLAIGKTGCGKSTFLLNVVRQQIESNRGVVLIDPHGDLADELLGHVPKRRTNDVCYFDASDAIVGFNPMVGPTGADANLVADAVLTSFKNVFGFDEGSAPRLLHIFRNCLLSLIGTRHASLSSVQRILVDANFRKSIVAGAGNEAVREFWLTEFNRWNDRDRTQYIASLQNKLGAFTTNERLQRIFEFDRKGIQLREIMDDSKVLICNLSKGRIGHDASTLLGTLLLSSLQIAAMSRADVDEDKRPDCVVVVDEFHSYLVDGNNTIASALAESRKYRTSYVLSTQMLEQLDSATLAGVLGNCGSTLCMTVGPRDAEVLAELLGSGLTTADLMKIPKYHGYLRMLIDGTPHTFSMTTLPPTRADRDRADLIRKVSRQRFGGASGLSPESRTAA